MADGDDRLSELPDDLLRRILHFSPLKEAASTIALSRRWRTPLWLSSGAVNLDTHVQDYDRNNYGSEREEDEARFFSRRNAFVSAAVAALDAADNDHLTRLTLRLRSDRDKELNQFLNDYTEKDRIVSHDRNVVDILLSHQAARHVEELRLVVQGWRSDARFDGEPFSNNLGFYWIALGSLPSKTLGVLELVNCRGLWQREANAVVLPRLSSLRLRYCSQDLRSLQRVIDAAPSLATIRLEYVVVDATEEARQERQPHCHEWDVSDDDHGSNGDDDHSNYDDDEDEEAPPTPPKEAAPRHLRCPAATLLVLERCRWKEEKNQGRDPYGGYSNDEGKPATLIGVEIDAPRLHRFRYKGLLRPFSFSPRPLEMEQVDLHFFPDDNRRKDPKRDLETFWRFVQSFTNTKEMRLSVGHFEDIAILSEKRQVELLPMFHRLERLELQGVHRPKGKTVGVAIANLLRCCPVLRDLRINLINEHHDSSRTSDYADEFFQRKTRSDREKFISCLGRCGDSEPSIVVLEGVDRGVNYDDASDIPGLSQRCSIECLRSSVRRVGLQFRFENSDCLGVKLIKFFAENAMVLEEMHIDAGNEKFHEHINPKVERWIYSSSKRRKSGATSFVIMPLNR